jgi:hypothetical protein
VAKKKKQTWEGPSEHAGGEKTRCGVGTWGHWGRAGRVSVCHGGTEGARGLNSY